MSHIHAEASTVIEATPQTVYSVLADYRRGHPDILPRKYFQNMEVEQGGTGAGTRIRFQMRTLGKTRTYRAEISEPEPGHILVEAYPDYGMVTTFTVEPVDGGKRASVLITTDWDSPGLQGWVERLIAPKVLHGIFVEELGNLARYVTS